MQPTFQPASIPLQCPLNNALNVSGGWLRFSREVQQTILSFILIVWLLLVTGVSFSGGSTGGDNGRFLYRTGGDYLSISHRNGGASTNGLADLIVKNGNVRSNNGSYF